MYQAVEELEMKTTATLKNIMYQLEGFHHTYTLCQFLDHSCQLEQKVTENLQA
jgi:hypothetical protein